MLSYTEENYLKALLKISLENEVSEVGTNELATNLEVKPATVSDMLKKLKEKELVTYEKYGKIKMTKTGRKSAINIVRKHRLWETFLFEKLEFSWDEVHEVAEQLEHIQSAKLIDKLDSFLNFPKFDPHGDPIPNAKGELNVLTTTTLANVQIGTYCKVAAVKDNSSAFLKYVDKIGLQIDSKIKVLAKEDYDDLLQIEVNKMKFAVSQKFAENILVLSD
jgi:DtxR family Mn-dependent transcriptional regulator